MSDRATRTKANIWNDLDDTKQAATEETLSTIELNTTVGLLSPENSTTTPLLAGATFTGTAVDLKDYVTVNVVIKASHASATDGLCIDFSTDGINWDITECHTIPAATGEAHLSRAKGRYCRVRYTNGGTNQTYFRLYTVFKNTAVSMTYEALSSDIDDTHDAALVRSVLAAKKPNGDYINIQATTAGNLKVSIEETNGTSNIAQETGGNLDRLSDSLQDYKISDVDADASPNYYGYTRKDGYWYILKETISAGNDTYRYAKGTSGYTTNWTNRVSLTYNYFDTEF